MKIANIDREFLHIFQTTCGNSIKFSAKMCFKDNIKGHKKPGFHPLFRRYIFQKTTGMGVNLLPPRHFGVNISCYKQFFIEPCSFIKRVFQIGTKHFEFNIWRSIHGVENIIFAAFIFHFYR